MKKTSKIAIVGSGYVGASIAYALMLKNLTREIILIDHNFEKSEGEALDITHGIPYMGDTVVFQGKYEDISGCDIIIITAGKNRKKGQSRIELLENNKIVLKQISQNIMKYYTGGIIFLVTNPVDALTYFMTKWCGLDRGEVIGTGCLLDTSRLVSQIAKYVGLSNESIHAMVVGEHGEWQQPIWSRAMIGNSPISEYCHEMGLSWNRQIREEILGKVQATGADIIKRKERTHYGIATCVCYLANSIVNDHHIVAPVSSVLNGEYGISDIAMSVPTVIGKKGIEKRLVEKWTEEELCFLKRCADKLKKDVI